MITAKVESISPLIAEQMFQKNTSNYRTIDMAKVHIYEQQMREGLWQTNGEAIVFDEDGILKNGQHRLAAIVKSGTTQDILVVRGVDRAVMLYDDGKQRTISQIANSYGYTIDGSLSGAIGIIEKGFNGSSHYGKIEIISAYESDKDRFDKIHSYARTRNGDLKGALLKKSACIAALYCASVMQILPDKDLKVFCEIVNAGMPVEGYVPDAALKLRNTLLEGMTTINPQTGARVPLTVSRAKKPMFEATFQAINVFRTQKKIVGNRKFKGDGKGNDTLETVRILTGRA